MPNDARWCLALALAVVAPTIAHAQDEQAERNVLITAERMLDVKTGRLINAPVILVRGDRIVSIGENGREPSVPAGTERVKLDGLTLLPGLIDMHVHLDLDPTYGGYTYLEFSDRFWSVLMVPHASRTLDAGFTTVR